MLDSFKISEVDLVLLQSEVKYRFGEARSFFEGLQSRLYFLSILKQIPSREEFKVCPLLWSWSKDTMQLMKDHSSSVRFDAEYCDSPEDGDLLIIHSHNVSGDLLLAILQ